LLPFNLSDGCPVSQPAANKIHQPVFIDWLYICIIFAGMYPADTEAPLTARARKAAQAVNAQGKQSAAPAGKSVTAKNQPKQKQRQAPNNNGAGKTGALPINPNQVQGNGKAKTGVTPQTPKGQAPAPKKKWQTQRQKRVRAPGAAATDKAQGKTPSEAAPVQKKQPVAV